MGGHHATVGSTPPSRHGVWAAESMPATSAYPVEISGHASAVYLRLCRNLASVRSAIPDAWTALVYSLRFTS